MNPNIPQSPNPAAPAVTPAEVYPGHAADVAKAERRARELATAASAPLPGPLREAFAGEPVRLHGLTLQPVNAWLLAILTRINSPLLEIIATYRRHAADLAVAPDAAARHQIQDQIQQELAAVKTAPESVIETVFAFTTDVEELQSLLDAGRFRAEALRRIGKVFHPIQVADLERAIGEHFGASFATALNMEAPAKNDGSVFTPPPAKPATASAGGLNSSAC